MEYKGLTIQIGGDTSELDRALKKVNKTARSTQNQLKGLERATKMDPTAVGAMDHKLAMLGKRSEIVATQITTLQQNIKALGNVKAKGTAGSIDKLSKATKNAALEAAQAEQAYNKVNSRLEEMYRNIKKSSGVDLHNTKGYEKAIRNLEKQGKVAKGTADEFIKLKQTWDQVANRQTDMRAVASLQKQRDELAKLQAQYRAYAKEEADFTARGASDRHFSALNRQLEVTNSALRSTKGRLNELKEAFEIRPTGRAMSEYTRTLKEEIATTKVKAKELKQALAQPQTQEYIKLANSVKNVGLELERAKAKQVALRQEIQSKTAEMAQTNSASKKSALIKEIQASEQALARVTAEVERLGKAEGAKRLEADLLKTEATAHRLSNTLRSVSQIKTTSFDGAEAKFRAVDNAVASTQERMERLRDSSVRSGMAVRKEYGQAVKESLNAAKEKAKLLNDELNKPQNKKYVELAHNTEDLALKLEKAKAKQEQLNIALDNLKTKQSAVKRGTAEFGEYERKIHSTKAALNDVNATVTNLGQAGKMRGLQDDLSKTNAQIEKMSKGPIRTMSGKALAAITVGAAYVGRRVVEMTNEVDTSFRNMSKTVEGSAEELDTLKARAKEFSLTHVTSPQQILEIEAMGGQLGIAVDQLEHFSEVIAQLDIATDIDATQIAQNFGQLSNIKKDFDIDGAADSLVRLGNNMPTLESGIMDVATRIAGISEIVKMSTPDMLAWSAAISSTGQQAEAGATAISRTMSTIEQLVANNGKALKKGGADLGDYAKVAGMTAQEFAAAWKGDPSQALKAFIDGLSEVEKAGGSTEKVITELGIEGVRQKTVIEALTATSENLTNALTMSKDAWEGIGDEWGAAGDAAREADKKSQGFSGALSMLKNSVTVLGSEFGEALAPAMKVTAKMFSTFASTLNSMSPAMKTFLASAMALAAIEGITKRAFNVAPMMTFVKWLAKVTAKSGSLSSLLMTGIGKIPGLITSGLGSIKAAFTTFLGAINPIGLAIAVVIGAVSAGLFKLAKAHKRQKEVAKESAGALEEVQKVMQEVAATSKSTGNGVDVASMSLDDLADRAKKSSQRTRDLAKALQETKQSTADQVAGLSEYADVIEKFARNGAKSKEEQALFTAAVKKYNDVTGDTLEIIDAENGRLRKNGEEIQNVKEHLQSYIKEKERSLWAEYYLEQKIKSKAERDRKGREISGINDEISALQADNQYGKNRQKINELIEQKKQAVEELNSLNGLITDSETHMAEIIEGKTRALADVIVETFGIGKEAATQYAEHLMQMGVSTEQYMNLSLEQQTAIKEAYADVLTGAEGSVAHYIQVLKDAGIDMSEYTDILQEDWAQALSATEQLTLVGLAKLSQTAAQGMNQLTAATGLSVAEVARTLQAGFQEGKISSSATMEEMVAYIQKQTKEMGDNAKNDVPKTTEELKKVTDGVDDSVSQGFANALRAQESGQQAMLNSAHTFVSNYNAALSNMNQPNGAGGGGSKKWTYGGYDGMFLRSSSGADFSGGAIYRTLQQRYNGGDSPFGRIYTPGMGFINEGGMAGGSRSFTRGPINGGPRGFMSKPALIDGTFIQRPSNAEAQRRVEQSKEANRFIAQMRQESISKIDQLQTALAEQSDRTANEVRALRRELGQVIADNAPVRIVTEREARRYIGRVNQ